MNFTVMNKIVDGSTDSISRDEESRPQTPQLLPTYKYRALNDRVNERVQTGAKFFSLEFFPPRTPNGAANLIARYGS